MSAGATHVWKFCAGYAAKVAAGFDEDAARYACWEMFDDADDLIRLWNRGDLEHWRSAAVVLMCRAENVAAVALVARHLQQHRTLDTPYLGMLVQFSDGECTEAEFESFVQMRQLEDQVIQDRRVGSNAFDAP